MDDFQTQYLEALAAEARAQETLLDRARTILQNPKQHGWETMARAAVVLPLVGIGAALTELQRALVSGSLDGAPTGGSQPT